MMRALPVVMLLLSAAVVYGQAGCGGPLAEAVSTIELPASPFSVAIAADGCHAFVSLMGQGGGIAVVERKGGRVRLLRTVAMPSRVAGLALTHDGKRLIAAAFDDVLVLDTACLIAGCAKPVAAKITARGKPQFIHANVSPGDRWLFVAEEAGAAITVIELATMRTVGRIPTGHAPIAIDFSADGRHLFATVQRAKEDWGWPAACDGQRPEGALMVVDVAARSVVHRVPAGCGAVRLALSPTRDRVYVTARAANKVLAFDAARLVADPTHARIGEAEVGPAPVPIAVIHNGATVIAGNSNRFATPDTPQTLTVLDATKFGSPALATIPAGAFPRDLKLSADGHALYLANYGSKTLQVFDAGELSREYRKDNHGRR